MLKLALAKLCEIGAGYQGKNNIRGVPLLDGCLDAYRVGSIYQDTGMLRDNN